MKQAQQPFTKYQIFVVVILTFLQFTIVLDFMVLSPLGAQLMKELAISTRQFGWVVSAYAFSAGISALLAAGFADKFDRKKLLMFFYTGFIIGTFFCAIAPDYLSLLIARIVTGIFGGVIGSITFAIITDLFAMNQRGRVMGFVQMAFASSQIMGIPLGLYLANSWGWHAPFTLIVVVSVFVAILIVLKLKPIDEHLKIQKEGNPFRHLVKIVTKFHYIKGFGAIALLATGGFMLMPFASAFTVFNLGISLDALPLIYMVAGIFSMIAGPIAGKISDQKGKYPVFVIGSVMMMILTAIYCNLGVTSLVLLIVIYTMLMIGVTSRMVSASALLTAVPDPADRGAYMSIQSSVQQISGGVATIIAGLIVVQSPNGYLNNYDLLGYVVILATIVALGMMFLIDKSIKEKSLGQLPDALVPVYKEV